jgi:LmbE family N-acetylglucosaminyl deacetylase
VTDPLRLLAVFPHPDDETLGLGPTLAKYSAEGVETYLLCATRGERGWNGPEEENPGPEALGKLREMELRCAAEKLGLREVVHLNYIDGDVDQANPYDIIAEIVSQMRRIRPQVVVTFCYDGNYGHPDHIALTQFTAAAVVCAADSGYLDPADLPAYRILKFYHMVDSIPLVEAIENTIGGISITVDGVERKQAGWDDWAITTRIEASGYFDMVWEAVLCHQSQLPGYGPFVDLPRETLVKLFGTGNYIRVFSLVNGGRKLEQDLFEGLR